MGKIFLPLIDNGTGIVRAQYMICAFRAFAGRDIAIARVSNPYPTRAMNIATALFLRSDCDEMLVVDMDIEFSREDVDCILEHDEPLVFGLYPKKQFPLTWCINPISQANPFSGNSDLCEVKRAGRGFMRVKRKAFSQLDSIAPEYSSELGTEREYWREGCDATGEWKSEDWQFCDDWRALGNRVLIDRRVCLNHIGDFSFGSESTDQIQKAA